MFCVASGRRPLEQYTNDDVIATIRRGEELELAWLPSTRLLTELRPTMERCMALKPEERPTAQELHDMTRACQVTQKPGSGDNTATSFTESADEDDANPRQTSLEL
mmetsp:Transcript_26409/g.78709  ORF Transcript_26409/g.78709 Transcript_26409/m.78709 type:complete len:106 (+) Transcript_26409:2-319(+)